jgi:hypothetical protein
MTVSEADMSEQTPSQAEGERPLAEQRKDRGHECHTDGEGVEEDGTGQPEADHLDHGFAARHEPA